MLAAPFVVVLANRSYSLAGSRLLFKSAILAFCLVAWLVPPTSPVAVAGSVDHTAPDRSIDDLKLIQGLRERRLYGYAEKFCQQQLKSAAEGSRRQIDLVIERIRIHADQAIFDDVDQRESHWDAALDIANDFIDRHQQHPRLVLVQIQQALTRLTLANVQQRQLDAAADPQLRASALESSRQARSTLQRARKQVSQRLVDARRQEVLADSLSAEECLNLQRNIGLHLAKCGFNRARLYSDDDRLNRVSALSEVAGQLTELQKLNSLGEPLWWQTQLAMVECHRLLDQFDEARERLNRMLAADLNATRGGWQDEILLQNIELAIATDSTTEGELLLTLADKVSPLQPELELACVDLLLAMAAKSGDAHVRREHFEQAQRRVEEMGQQHGAWWGRQGSLLLLAAGSSQFDPQRGRADDAAARLWLPQFELALRVGNEALEQGRHLEAIRAFDQASVLARDAEQTDQWISCGVKSAESYEALGQHVPAGDRLLELATRNPASSLSPAIHLRACWNFGRSGGDAQQHVAFAAALRQHLSLFPASGTCNQARLWLGQQLSRQNESSSAVEVLLQVVAGSPQRLEAYNLAVVAIRKILDAPHPASELPTKSALQWCRRITDSSPPDNAAAMLAVSEIALRYGVQLDESISKSLTDLLANDISEPAKSQAAALLLGALFLESAEPEQLAEASRWLKANPTAAALETCSSVLQKLEPRVPVTHATRVKEARLECLSLLLATTDRSATHLLYQQAVLLAELGRPSESLPILKQLSDRLPRQAELKMQLARVEMQIAGDRDQSAVLSRWREIATQLKPGTANWFEAKYYVARYLFDLGKQDQSRQLLDYLAVLPGGWSESAFADRFDELLREHR